MKNMEVDKMGGLTEEVTVPIDLGQWVKHPECVDRIVAELKDGKEVRAGIRRPAGLVAYRIEYKEGPCREECPSLHPEIQEVGCYAGRVTRIHATDR